MRNRMILLICSCVFCLLYSDVWASNHDVQPKVLKAVDNSAELRSKIVLTVNNLTALVQEATAKNKKIIPYLDGLPLTGVETSQTNANTIRFFLERTEKSKKTWTTLVQQRTNFFSSQVSVSVGLEDGVPVPTEIGDFKLIVIKESWFTTCLIVIVLFIALFLWLAGSSNIIRDPGPDPVEGGRRPYSIGRTQMAIWFFLVLASYPFIWLITGELSTITGSVIGLMGISAGTALGATVIDKNKSNAALSNHDKLLAEKTALDIRINEIAPAVKALPLPPNLDTLKIELDKKRTRLAEVEQQILRTPAVQQGRASQGFFLDVISDKNGVSFHRFQIFAWTIVLGIIFVAEVYNNLKMPEFSETLLALMGISSGTYMGFKFPEQKQS